MNSFKNKACVLMVLLAILWLIATAVSASDSWRTLTSTGLLVSIFTALAVMALEIFTVIPVDMLLFVSLIIAIHLSRKSMPTAFQIISVAFYAFTMLYIYANYYRYGSRMSPALWFNNAVVCVRFIIMPMLLVWSFFILPQLATLVAMRKSQSDEPAD